MNENLPYEKIERYLTGEMNEEEHIAFEERMSKDSNLEEEVKLHQDIEAALTEKDVISFENNISNVFDNAAKEMEEAKVIVPKERKATIIPFKRILSIAASILLIVTTLFFASNFNSPKSIVMADLVETNGYFPATLPNEILNDNATRGKEEKELKDKIDLTWKKAIGQYNNNNFANTIPLLNEIEELDYTFKHISTFQFHFYRGVAYLKLNAPKKAAVDFDKVDRYDATYGNDAYWNKALSLLLTPDSKDDAIDYLEAIANSEHPKKGNAKKILDQIKIE